MDLTRFYKIGFSAMYRVSFVVIKIEVNKKPTIKISLIP